jgi:hypothetical protein
MELGSGYVGQAHTQLKAVITASSETSHITEESHILDRLKSIFRLT